MFLSRLLFATALYIEGFGCWLLLTNEHLLSVVGSQHALLLLVAWRAETNKLPTPLSLLFPLLCCHIWHVVCKVTIKRHAKAPDVVLSHPLNVLLRYWI